MKLESFTPNSQRQLPCTLSNPKPHDTASACTGKYKISSSPNVTVLARFCFASDTKQQSFLCVEDQQNETGPRNQLLWFENCTHKFSWDCEKELSNCHIIYFPLEHQIALFPIIQSEAKAFLVDLNLKNPSMQPVRQIESRYELPPATLVNRKMPLSFSSDATHVVQLYGVYCIVWDMKNKSQVAIIKLSKMSKLNSSGHDNHNHRRIWMTPDNIYVVNGRDLYQLQRNSWIVHQFDLPLQANKFTEQQPQFWFSRSHDPGATGRGANKSSAHDNVLIAKLTHPLDGFVSKHANVIVNRISNTLLANVIQSTRVPQAHNHVLSLAVGAPVIDQLLEWIILYTENLYSVIHDDETLRTLYAPLHTFKKAKCNIDQFGRTMMHLNDGKISDKHKSILRHHLLKFASTQTFVLDMDSKSRTMTWTLRLANNLPGKQPRRKNQLVIGKLIFYLDRKIYNLVSGDGQTVAPFLDLNSPSTTHLYTWDPTNVPPVDFKQISMKAHFELLCLFFQTGDFSRLIQELILPSEFRAIAVQLRSRPSGLVDMRPCDVQTWFSELARNASHFTEEEMPVSRETDPDTPQLPPGSKSMSRVIAGAGIELKIDDDTAKGTPVPKGPPVKPKKPSPRSSHGLKRTRSRNRRKRRGRHANKQSAPNVSCESHFPPLKSQPTSLGNGATLSVVSAWSSKTPITGRTSKLTECAHRKKMKVRQTLARLLERHSKNLPKEHKKAGLQCELFPLATRDPVGGTDPPVACSHMKLLF